jgi:hypothetical protein
MKKSFFLLTAALVAMFSFSACTDNKDDDDGPSSSSDGVVENPSSSSSSDAGEGPGPSSSSTELTTGLTVACEIEMTTVIGVFNLCQEYSDVQSSEINQLKDECDEMSEPGFVTASADSCPSGAGLECDDIDEDGEGVKTYYYEPGASMIRAVYGGCPDPSEL